MFINTCIFNKAVVFSNYRLLKVRLSRLSFFNYLRSIYLLIIMVERMAKRALIVIKTIVWRNPSRPIFLCFWLRNLLSILQIAYLRLRRFAIVSPLNKLYFGRVNDLWLVSPGYSIIELLRPHFAIIDLVNLRVIIRLILIIIRLWIYFNVKMSRRMDFLIEVFTGFTSNWVAYVWIIKLFTYLLSSSFENGVLKDQAILLHFKTYGLNC